MKISDWEPKKDVAFKLGYIDAENNTQNHFFDKEFQAEYDRGQAAYEADQEREK